MDLKSIFDGMLYAITDMKGNTYLILKNENPMPIRDVTNKKGSFLNGNLN